MPRNPLNMVNIKNPQVPYNMENLISISRTINNLVHMKDLYVLLNDGVANLGSITNSNYRDE